MGAVDLLQRLIADGVEFAVEGDRVRWRGAGQRMTPERLAVLKENKTEVLEFLASPSTAGQRSAEIVILAAIRAGNHRPGAIATETRMGATAAYQTLDRMREAGLVTVARDGHVTASGSLGEKANTNEGGRER